jgi:hypothetical protein
MTKRATPKTDDLAAFLITPIVLVSALVILPVAILCGAILEAGAAIRDALKGPP